MHPAKKIETFNDKYPLIGPSFWIASIQFFIVMFLVGLAWPTHYNIFNNTISDLGNTACGIYSGRYVCSPAHAWMNASFIILGATMVAGSLLIYQEFKESIGSAIAFTAMAIGGFGTILVGIFAENTISSLHAVAAALPFVAGNIALILLAFFLDIPKSLRIYTYLSGIISLAAILLFATHNYLGLGVGGMERLAVNPQTVWLIVFGIYMSRNHFREQR
jgi:hypothetical membrane protein